MEKTAEQAFADELTKRLREAKDISVELVSSHVLPSEEYAAHIGRIRMCDEALEAVKVVGAIYFGPEAEA